MEILQHKTCHPHIIHAYNSLNQSCILLVRQMSPIRSILMGMQCVAILSHMICLRRSYKFRVVTCSMLIFLSRDHEIFGSNPTIAKSASSLFRLIRTLKIVKNTKYYTPQYIIIIYCGVVMYIYIYIKYHILIS